MLDIRSTVSMPGGVKMPVLGLGVYLARPGVVEQAIHHAFKTGYRHIDTAQYYENEQEVGQAVRSSDLNREEVFVTTKLYSTSGNVAASLRKSVDVIGLGYVDLFLIHSPYGGFTGRQKAWKELEQLKKEGKTKAIGVSNYGVKHLEEMKQYAKEMPAVNQIELHPMCQQRKIVEYCQANNIVVQAYCPIARAQFKDDPTINAIAAEVGKTWAQVSIRWCLQKGFVPLPKSDNPSRIEQNAGVFDFELSPDQMKRLDALERDAHVTWDPTNAP